MSSRKVYGGMDYCVYLFWQVCVCVSFGKRVQSSKLWGTVHVLVKSRLGAGKDCNGMATVSCYRLLKLSQFRTDSPIKTVCRRAKPLARLRLFENNNNMCTCTVLRPLSPELA